MSDVDDRKINFEHSWKYFELHASQRISLFRFYIGFYSIYLTVAGYLIIKANNANGDEIMLMVISLLFILISIIFCLLDTRNRNLIKIAERSLCELERNEKWNVKNKVFIKEERTAHKQIRHSHCFKSIYCIAIFSAIFLLIYSLIKIIC